MAKINTLNYQTVASWNGSQDLFVVEQPDGTKVATPAMVKQFMEAGDFEATGEIKDGHGNILADMAKSDDVDAEIGDLSQTGLTGDSVAEQLTTVKGQVADVTSGISDITRKNITASTENEFLLAALADIKADSNSHTYASINRIYTWSGHDHYIIQGYRVTSAWIYAFVYSYDRAYILEYNIANEAISVKKTFTLT